MTQVILETNDGSRYSVDVETPSPREKMHIAARAPDELLETAENVEDVDNPTDVDIDFTPDVVDYLVSVATQVTELDEADLNQLTTTNRVELCAEILNTIFREDSNQSSNNRCVKRVQLTEDFITHLFRGEMAMVAGLPDDASFEDFTYDPSTMQLQFVFSSDEWEPVDEGEEIPFIEATCAEITGGTTEL